MMKHIIVTGGSGYIGTQLVRLALRQGRRVTCLGRSKSQNSNGIIAATWTLGEALPEFDFVGEDTAVIHLAHDWKNHSGSDGKEGGLNISGTQLLCLGAQQVGIQRFVFVSSQSAREDAPNIYGRVKWRIEQVLQEAGGVSARVGLVYGGPRIAMFGLLNKLVSKLPILPMISPWNKVQPIHVKEVCAGLLALADGQQEGWRGLAGPDPVSFGSVLTVLAREAHGRKIFILPVPLSLALFAARMLSFIPFLPKVDKERILGLAGTRVMPCGAHLSELGLDVASMESGLRHDHLGMRGLLGEANALLAYILHKNPPSSLMRRYVKAIKIMEGDAGPVGLFPLFIQIPFLLRLIEPLNRSRLLARRMEYAVSLVSAAGFSARLIKQSRSRRMLSLFFLISVDAMALPFRILSTVLTR